MSLLLSWPTRAMGSSPAAHNNSRFMWLTKVQPERLRGEIILAQWFSQSWRSLAYGEWIFAIMWVVTISLRPLPRPLRCAGYWSRSTQKAQWMNSEGGPCAAEEEEELSVLSLLTVCFPSLDVCGLIEWMKGRMKGFNLVHYKDWFLSWPNVTGRE